MCGPAFDYEENDNMLSPYIQDPNPFGNYFSQGSLNEGDALENTIMSLMGTSCINYIISNL